MRKSELCVANDSPLWHDCVGIGDKLTGTYFEVVLCTRALKIVAVQNSKIWTTTYSRWSCTRRVAFILLHATRIEYKSTPKVIDV